MVKKKIVTNYHTKHLGIYYWIHINLKHTKKKLRDDKKPLEYPRDITRLDPSGI